MLNKITRLFKPRTLQELLCEDGRLVNSKGKPVNAEPIGDQRIVVLRIPQEYPNASKEITEELTHSIQKGYPRNVNAYTLKVERIATSNESEEDVYTSEIQF